MKTLLEASMEVGVLNLVEAKLLKKDFKGHKKLSKDVIAANEEHKNEVALLTS